MLLYSLEKAVILAQAGNLYARIGRRDRGTLPERGRMHYPCKLTCLPAVPKRTALPTTEVLDILHSWLIP
jgi:hypothetical protein